MEGSKNNIRLLVEYDGTYFKGWQRQLELPTIQREIEDILRRVTKEPVVLIGSGRTDSGVHAAEQVCNFVTSYEMPANQWARCLNFYLPPTIRVIRSEQVNHAFHAQNDAKSKTYEYRILNRPVGSALDTRVLFYPKTLNWSLIQLAMPYFIGEHDFRSFQGPKAEVKTTIRQIFRLELDTSKSHCGIYRFEIEGSGFLKQMVRTMIGTLIEVGEGRISPQSIQRIIEACDRRLAGPTAPPQGLCLLKVNYAKALNSNGLPDLSINSGAWASQFITDS